MSRRAASLPESGRVNALTHDAEGVVPAGKTVFVAGALPGEEVRFVRRRRHRQYDEAELLEVLSASSERVTPACAHFALCGGCALQHLVPEAQLRHKEQQVRETLLRVGKVTPGEWWPAITGPLWNYRRRARLGARYVHNRGRSLVGFRERLSSYIAAIDTCRVLASPVDTLIQPLAELLSSLTIRERVPQIEVAVAEHCTALVLRVLDSPTDVDLQQLHEFEQRHDVRLYLQSGGLATVAPLRVPAPVLSYRHSAFDVELEFLPTDFVQINAAVNEKLVSRVVEILAPDAQSRVLDLYCGLGNFSVPLARRAGAVVGVEGEAGLVARARRNAELNGVDGCEFHIADLASPPPPETPWLRGGASHVLLDPPRAGADQVLAAVAALRPQRIAYVSCHPASLARDLGLLVHQHGYRLVAAGVADMFPHTAHVESLALLEP